MDIYYYYCHFAQFSWSSNLIIPIHQFSYNNFLLFPVNGKLFVTAAYFFQVLLCLDTDGIYC